jgi:AraC-like DNA-binding protein
VLAEELGMSRSQLFKKLKALTGLSATHFIRYYRLSMAKVSIEETRQPISEISYNVGFRDPAYFTRSFTKEFGYSPIQCREKFHSDNQDDTSAGS